MLCTDAPCVLSKPCCECGPCSRLEASSWWAQTNLKLKAGGKKLCAMQVSALVVVEYFCENLHSVIIKCLKTFCCFALFTRRPQNLDMIRRRRWGGTNQPVTFTCNSHVLVSNFLAGLKLSNIMKLCHQRFRQETPAEMPSDLKKKAHRSMKGLALAI